MSSYQDLLEKAIGALPENSIENRKAVYNHLRVSLETQLKNQAPALDLIQIRQEKERLEAAIQLLEERALQAERKASPEEGVLFSKLQDSPIYGTEAGSRKPEAHAQGGIFQGFLSKFFQKSGLMKLGALICGLLVVGIGALSLGFLREGESSSSGSSSQGGDAPRDGTKEETEASLSQGTELPSKETQRLVADRNGQTISTTAAPVSTTGIAGSPEGAAFPVSFSEHSEGKRAIFYEENAESDSAGDLAWKGSVTWSVESPREGEEQKAASVPSALAKVSIADRDLFVTLKLMPNMDSQLAAKYVVEIALSSQKEDPEKEVAHIPSLILKRTEQMHGEPLAAASVKVSPTLFWLALPSDPRENGRNESLLLREGWIDIPIVYKNGKRAILTLEKTEAASRAIAAVLRSDT